MTTLTTDSTHFVLNHPHIVQRTDITSLLLSSLLLLLGISCFLFVFRLEENDTAFPMAIMTIGAFLLLWGVFRLFWKSSSRVYQPTGSMINEKSLFFEASYEDSLREMIEHSSFDKSKASHCVSGGNLRLDFLFSCDKRFVALQLFHYVPYNYVSVTPIYYFTDAEAASVITFLSYCKAMK